MNGRMNGAGEAVGVGAALNEEATFEATVAATGEGVPASRSLSAILTIAPVLLIQPGIWAVALSSLFFKTTGCRQTFYLSGLRRL